MGLHVSGDGVEGGVHVDLVLLEAGRSLGCDEGFLFSRVMLCLVVTRSPDFPYDGVVSGVWVLWYV